MRTGDLEDAHALAMRPLVCTREYRARSQQAYALRPLGDLAAQRDPPHVEEQVGYNIWLKLCYAVSPSQA